jgi:hypothetical protein
VISSGVAAFPSSSSENGIKVGSGEDDHESPARRMLVI